MDAASVVRNALRGAGSAQMPLGVGWIVGTGRLDGTSGAGVVYGGPDALAVAEFCSSGPILMHGYLVSPIPALLRIHTTSEP